MIENRVVGIKSRELYEAPADRADHGSLGAGGPGADTSRAGGEARAGAPLGEARLRRLLVQPLRKAYDAFFAETQQVVTGDVRLSLQAGAAVVTKAPLPAGALRGALASYATGETFPHDAASGFITLAGLETELAASREARLSRHDRLGGTCGATTRAGGGHFLRADSELLEARLPPPRPIRPPLARGGLPSERSCATWRRGSTRSRRRARWSDADGAIHSAIERLLGPLGAQIHAGRSRNDQVAAATAQRGGRLPGGQNRPGGARAGDPGARDGGGGDGHARLHAPAAGAAP